jgi:ubiquinone/menaquinone biosynthesis C-methylase UbiE
MNVITLEKLAETDFLKEKLKAIWTAGDFGRIARFFTTGAAEFIARLNLEPGMRVLDVACGTGNQSLPAARAGAVVTALDIAPNLLAQARKRAAAEELTIRFDEGDAENLPYENGTFDAVISMFGAMFAPRHDKVSAELIRVCRPGGRIAMANWTAEGFVGKMFGLINSYLPPLNTPSPLYWGDEQRLKMNFGAAVSNLQCTPRLIDFTFPYSVAATIEIWREYYGPVYKAFESLNESGQTALRSDLEKLWSENNLSANGATRIKAEYLEVVATRNY